ncbi:MAG: hypothetical protein II612_06795 [Prevotella sp.]|jgi:hypothetical protein|nr:hypothetical protein [Prevotella sp.]
MYMNSNKKKAILLLTAFETMLLVILTMLYFRQTISMRIYVGIVLTIAFFSSTIVLLILRR